MSNENGIFEQDWLGFDWSSWMEIEPEGGIPDVLPTDEGLYRVRHDAYEGLVYIGETGRSVRGRLGSLMRGVFDGEMPFSDPHTGSPSLWSIVDRHGPGFEVSVATPEQATDSQQRKAIEDALIALHRRERGKTPVGNFGRMPPGYEKSKKRSSGERGGQSDDDERRSFHDDAPALPWENAEEVTSRDWMGVPWTRPASLSEARSNIPKDPGLYRIWNPDKSPPLEYIGQTVNLHSRLNTHRRNRDESLQFSYAEQPELSEGHKLSQVETDLLGGHWLACRESPRDQY